MTRISFLKSLFAPLLVPFITAKKTETEIERLEWDYCKASNALTSYRRRLGFEPGARVQAQSLFGKKEKLLGVIAPYGPRWGAVDSLHVLVRLDKGYTQPWMMSDLTIISKA